MIGLVLALSLGGCAADADCVVTTWECCGCIRQRAVSKEQLKAEEDECAAKGPCSEHPGCKTPKPDSSLVAVCKAGACALSKPAQTAPAKAECQTAADCEVWCCQEDLGAAVKGKKPRPGCKRCPKPQPAAECLEGKCAVAPRALEK